MPLQTEYRKAEFLLIATGTEKSRMLKNMTSQPWYLPIWQVSQLYDLITSNFVIETSGIWLSVGEVKY